MSSAYRFQPNAWVWIPDESERYLPAKVLTVFSPGQKTTVLTEDGEKHTLDSAQSAQVVECNPEALNSKIEDLVNISDLNEMSILHNLRIRFKEDKIYTNISSILISVNPFKLLPLYTPEVADNYRNGYRGKAPHIFGVAYNAYTNMLTDAGDQSVVISGESGAGKSEATKLILQFLTDLSSRSSAQHAGSTQSVSSTLEQQILASNPLLEAFGNAKTLRNNNSSRFGKLITVNFDTHGSIIGGGIINYLLEKSRVVSQNMGERNYHIFYQLLSAADTNPTMTNTLKLQNPELFDYTNKSGVIMVEGMSDEKDFEEVQNSMDILKFTAEQKLDIFSIVAGVLHFGNVKFKTDKRATEEDAAVIVNSDIVAHACKLWQVDPSLIEKYLCCKNIGVDNVHVTYNVHQAQDARDAMVKRVYAELFQFIVDKINAELAITNRTRHKFIGVLDIFGFESFEINSFEQLCINYCNEKLQFHFNEHIFRMEQALYMEEGITLSATSFVDNQPTLDLLEERRLGIFSICDEEISVPKGSDDGFLQKVLQRHSDGKHPNMLRPKNPRDCKDHLRCFGILHYAGPVFYHCANFLEKNKDLLHPDIISVLRVSKMPMVQKMFPQDKTSTKLTLAGQFKGQLNDLINTLNITSPHFVRCMKSNDLRSGNVFTSSRMQDQLRYAGLVEVCRIRKLGYPVRREHLEFFKRFKCIDLLSPNIDALLKSLQSKSLLKAGEWQKGHSRIFMRTLQAQELEVAREAAFLGLAILVQRMGRGMIMRRKYKHYKKIIQIVKDAIVSRNEPVLKDAIDLSLELPWGGLHLAVVVQCKALLARVREEIKVEGLLSAALKMMEINGLKSAIHAAGAMDPPFSPPILTQAVAALARLEAELVCKNNLLAAIALKDPAKLSEAIAAAEKMNFTCNELHQAIALKARIDLENSTIAQIVHATGTRDIDALNAALSKCVELGIDSRSEVVSAKVVIKEVLEEQARLAAAEAELKKQQAAVEAARQEAEKQRLAIEAAARKRHEVMEEAEMKLKHALDDSDYGAISEALSKALQLGMNIPLVEKAQTALTNRSTADDLRSQLRAAVKVLTMKADDGVSPADLVPLKDAIDKATKARAPDLEKDLVDANEAYDLHLKHLRARADLTAAVAAKDRKQLRAALDAAENLDLNIEITRKAKDVLKDLENAHRAGVATGAVQDVPEPYDAAEQARKQRQELAKQTRFDIKNFPNLRTSDDFARGAILNKSKVRESFLTFQGTVIPKSLTDLNKDYNKLAMQIHKDLLGYMGDKQMPFPAMLAQDILRKGYEYKPIRDEIYLQIIKQLSSNPRPESVAKGWQIMCMCVGTFPPSYDFENFLLHYIIEKRDRGRGAVVDYARYCLRTLEAMLSNGDGTGFVPSVEEILAYKERPPILATIHLVDGNVITEDLPITPDLNVGKVLEMCSGWLDLKDPRVDSLGMFVYDLGETEDVATMDESYKTAEYRDLIRTPRPLRNDDFMGDIIVQRARQRRRFKFVLKKKIFLPQNNGRGGDPFYERLVYLQAEDESIIQGNIDLDDEEKVAGLAGISMAVAFGEDMGSNVSDLVAGNVIDFIVPSWRPKQSPEQWAEMILLSRDALVAADPEDLQDQFLQIVQESPLYGMHWFYVYKVDTPHSVLVPMSVRSLPRKIMLGFNAEGMHVFSRSRERLISFPYADIYRWGGSSSQFSLIMADPSMPDSFEFVIITGQAADMAAIILDHIRAIMAEHDGDRPEA